MHCTDTDAKDMKAVRFEHLHVKGMRKFNAAVKQAKRLVSGNAYVLVKLSGGNIDTADPLIPIKAEDE